MLSTNSRSIAYARSVLVLNADSVWKIEDGANFKRTNLEEWVRLNRLERLLKRTTVSDSFSLIIKSHKKTVRCIIPFRPLLVLGNYGFDEYREYVYTAEIGKNAYQDVLDRGVEACIEPWMLPEVEEAFKLLSKGFSVPADFTACYSEDSGSVSHPSCGRLYPFYKPTCIQYSVFDYEKQKCNYSGAHERQLSSIVAALNEVGSEREAISEELTEFRFRMLDFSSALFLVRYPQLLFPVISSEIPYEVCEVEVVADFAGKCYQHPVSEEELGALLNPVSDDDIERFPIPRFSVRNQEERLLYYKTFSESVRDFWKYYTFKFLDDRRLRRINFLEKTTEVSVWNSCMCSRCVPPAKRQKPTVKTTVYNPHVPPPKCQNSPVKPRGLNVEVPEFFPRKEESLSHCRAGQNYFPSASTSHSQETIFPYAPPEWLGNNFSQASTPSATVNSNYNTNNYGATCINNPQPPYNIQPNFHNQTVQHYYLQNYSNQQQVLQPVTQNNFAQSQQMAIGWNQRGTFPSNGLPPVPEYETRPAGTIPFQQPWMANMYGNQYQQQLQNPQQAQLASLYYSSQQLPYLQSQTNELLAHSAQKWPNAQAYQSTVPQMNAGGIQIQPRNQIAEAAPNQYISAPKNIPVYQRPPESYTFAQGDGNGRRRNGGVGGGGGVVLTNLIVLTKGGGRCKGVKQKVYDPGSSEQETKDVPSNEGEENCETVHTCSDSKENVEESGEGNRFEELPSDVTVTADSSTNMTPGDSTPTLTGVDSLEYSRISVDSTNKSLLKESDTSDRAFSRDGVVRMLPEMTSTPKRTRRRRKDKRERVKWLDVSSPKVNVMEAVKCQSLSVESCKISSPEFRSKNLDDTKSSGGEFSGVIKVKACYSDPSFPPIQAYRPHSRRRNQSNASSTPSPSASVCQRRLYRDVLVPNLSPVSFQTNAGKPAVACVSVDSLEGHFGELERLATEQYQSSDESLNRAYQELEIQAREQYRSSSESVGKFLAEIGEATLNDQEAELAEKNGNLSVSGSLCDLSISATASVASQEQALPAEYTPPSEQRRLVVIMRPNMERSYSSIANGDSLSSDDESGPKTVVECEDHIEVDQSKLIAAIQKPVSGETVEDLDGQQRQQGDISGKGKPTTTREKSDPNALSRDNTAIDFLPNPSSEERRAGFSDNLTTVQQETPNDQRTQVSHSAGIETENEKEDLAASAEVPEAWVPNQHPKQITFQNSLEKDVIKQPKTMDADNKTLEVGPCCKVQEESVVAFKKKSRRQRKKKRGKKVAALPVNDQSGDATSCKKAGKTLEKCNGIQEEGERNCESPLKRTVYNVPEDTACGSFACERVTDHVYNPTEEISEKMQENAISGSSVTADTFQDDQELTCKFTVSSNLEEISLKSGCTVETDVVAGSENLERESGAKTTPVHQEGESEDQYLPREADLQESVEVICLTAQKGIGSESSTYGCLDESGEIREVLRGADSDMKESSSTDLGFKQDELNLTNLCPFKELPINSSSQVELPEELEDSDARSNPDTSSASARSHHFLLGKFLPNNPAFIASLKRPLLSTSSPRTSSEMTPRTSHSSHSSKSSSSSISGLYKMIRRAKRDRKVKRPRGNGRISSPSCALQ